MVRKHSPAFLKSLCQKAILVIFGIALSVFLLEITLRLGAFLFSSLQEYRNRQAAFKRGAYRIMCLGESTTALGGNDSYPSQLEEVLNQRNLGITFSVINKGVPGIGSAYILDHLEENLNQYHPDMVTAMMGINDKLIKYYEDVPMASLLNRFRTYKLFRLLWMNIIKTCYAQDIKPQNEQDYVESGRYYRDSGNFAKAEELFQKALNLNPGNDAAYVELGACYLNEAKDAQAIEMFKKAIELNPGNEQAYVELGRYYRDQRKYAQAEEALKKAIEINPKAPWPYILLGLCSMYQDEYAQSEQAFKKAIELNPTDDRAYGGLAALYAAMGLL